MMLYFLVSAFFFCGVVFCRRRVAARTCQSHQELYLCVLLSLFWPFVVLAFVLNKILDSVEG